MSNDTPHSSELTWIYPKSSPFKDEIIHEFHLPPVIAQILVSRGFSTIEQVHNYLYAQLPDLFDPFLMTGMAQAVERICKAIESSESILIYGDNDVDGMTGTALLTELLRRVGANVFSHISNRSILRQRLYIDALEAALANNCKLMITVDCGITAAAEIAQVVEKNVEVIITDHHEPTDKIPLCVATLNPKLVGNPYPNRDLTGVGVAFKLAHGVTNQLVAEGKLPPKKVDLKRLLDLVALGTVSDMGSLQGENRILVRYGLRQLRRNRRLGLAKLMSVCDVEASELTTFDIASKIAPRLNSLGRIDDPQKGVELLLVKNAGNAEDLALELDLNNIERQKIERLVSADVENILQKEPAILKDKAVVLFSEKWHPGVIAIISTRISKLYNRPTAIIAVENNIGKGSLRSIPEFPLLNVLKDCKDLLLNFGGHDFAAGLTIQRQLIEEFKKRFIVAANAKLRDEDVLNRLPLDAEVSFNDLTFDFLESMRLLEPFGNENPAPVLYCEATQAWPPKVIGTTHLRMYLEQGDRILEGIAFGRASSSRHLRRKNLKLLVAFTPQVNIFQKKSSIQLLIRDFKIMS